MADLRPLARLLGATRLPAATTWPQLIERLARDHLAASFVEDDGDDGELEDSAAVIALVTSVATRVALSPTAFAWHDPRKYDQYTATAMVRAIADALSAERVAIVRLVVADKARHVIAVVPWADRDRIVAAAKAAGQRAIALGPKRPRAAPPRAAKPVSKAVKRLHVRGAWHMPWRPSRPEAVVFGNYRDTTEQLDVSTWPPKRSVLVPSACGALAFHPDGDLAYVAIRKASPTADDRTPFLERRDARGQVTQLVNADELEIERLGFVGDDLVILPKDWCYRGKHVSRPLICRAGKRTLAPIAELPPAKVVPWSKTRPCDFLREGFARTGAGTDVLIWDNAGYVRSGKQLVRRFELPKQTVAGQPIATCPAEGDAFFALAKDAIYEIRAGEPAVRRIPIVDDAENLVAGPDGCVLVRMIRRAKTIPLMYAWWTARREYAAVGPTVFGYGKGGTTWFNDHGYAAASELVWGYETLGDELRAVAWGVIAALPRLPEVARKAVAR